LEFVFCAHETAERPAGVVQRALDRPLADPEPTRDVLDRQVAVVVKDDDLPLTRGELTDRRGHRFHEAHRQGRLEDLRWIARAIQRELLECTILGVHRPPPRSGEVGRHRGHPWLELPDPLAARVHLPRSHQCLLNDILGGDPLGEAAAKPCDQARI